MSTGHTCAIVLCVVLLVTGCESIQTHSDYDPAADFSGYRSFSWVADNPLMGSTAGGNPLTRERVQQAIVQTLTAKGYQFVADRNNADFVVGFTVGARDKVRVDTTTQPMGFRGPYGRWGMAYYQEVDVREYSEGRLAIDVFDVELKRPVWHGYGTKSLTGGDEKEPEKLINSAVAAILADFPSGSGQ